MTKREESKNRTRESLIQAAFDEIYANGFQAASLNRIIEAAGASKGAMYHHFKSKTELGYAVIESVIKPMVKMRWLDPLETNANPIDVLVSSLRASVATKPPYARRLGCPVANLVNEMSPLDEGFRIRLQNVLEDWQAGVARALQRGIDRGTVRPDVDPQGAACFFVASIEGASGMIKNSRNESNLERLRDELIGYLDHLRYRQTAAGSPNSH